MARVLSLLAVMVACLALVSVASAQEKHKGKGMDPAARWDAIAKAADKADATTLKSDEFISGFVKSIPDAAPQKMKDGAKDRAQQISDKIKDGDGNVTKDAFVKYMKENMGKHKKQN